MKTHFAVAALALTLSTAANAYETGQLTCQNVGQLAAQTVLAKQAGIPYGAYLTALGERLPAEAQIERKLATNLTAVIYESPLVDNMQPDDAYAAFVQDCVARQPDGQMQEDEGDQNDTAAQRDQDDEQ